MGLDVLSDRLVSSGSIHDSSALHEVAALMSKEEHWAMAALFSSLLAESLRERWPLRDSSEAKPDKKGKRVDGGGGGGGGGADSRGAEGCDGREWYLEKCSLLCSYLGMERRTRDFFRDMVLAPDPKPAHFADFFARPRIRPAPECVPAAAGGAADGGGGEDGGGGGGGGGGDGGGDGGGGSGGGGGGESSGDGVSTAEPGGARGAGAGGGVAEGGGRRAGWAACWLGLVCLVDGGGPGARLRYDARGRGVARRLARALGAPWAWIAQAETALCVALHLTPEAAAAKLAQEERAAAAAAAAGGGAGRGGWGVGRYAKVGGAALVGGAVIGLTGGLATPAVVAGLGVLGAAVGAGGALAAGAAAFGGLSTVLAVSFGGLGAGLVGYKARSRARARPLVCAHASVCASRAVAA